MSLTLYLLLLGPLRCSLAVAQCKEEEYPVGAECCPKCGPGFRVKEACGEVTGTLCVPCDPGTYTAHFNGLSECLQCRVCDPALGLSTPVPSQSGASAFVTPLVGPSRTQGPRRSYGHRCLGPALTEPRVPDCFPSSLVLRGWTSFTRSMQVLGTPPASTPHLWGPLLMAQRSDPHLLPAGWSGVEGLWEEIPGGWNAFGSSQVGSGAASLGLTHRPLSYQAEVGVQTAHGAAPQWGLRGPALPHPQCQRREGAAI
ncbi:tumor necrosis factor receptor superfamily member 14 isoform X1 [Hyaena hyaena]|uniref:tumor necrosis factor receptor superfamily member 14 isoform X1 n=1 Tax=Hyaena hyaena TaxID=95912 RepID=UPI0019244F7A|nr:tumor necrosis factor receptor superfamily member 14 isoform X1 [Hyaena hyaena]